MEGMPSVGRETGWEMLARAAGLERQDTISIGILPFHSPQWKIIMFLQKSKFQYLWWLGRPQGLHSNEMNMWSRNGPQAQDILNPNFKYLWILKEIQGSGTLCYRREEHNWHWRQVWFHRRWMFLTAKHFNSRLTVKLWRGKIWPYFLSRISIKNIFYFPLQFLCT